MSKRTFLSFPRSISGGSGLLGDLVVLAVFAAAPVALATAVTGGYGSDQAFRQAKLSLADAISVAQNDRDGKAIIARYAADGQAGAYEISVVSYGQLDVLAVDPNSGQTHRRAGAGASKSDQESADFVARAHIGIAQAIAAAEAQGGVALGARLEAVRGKPAYRVDVRDDGVLSRVWIDAASGHILEKS